MLNKKTAIERIVFSLLGMLFMTACYHDQSNTNELNNHLESIERMLNVKTPQTNSTQLSRIRVIDSILEASSQSLIVFPKNKELLNSYAATIIPRRFIVDTSEYVILNYEEQEFLLKPDRYSGTYDFSLDSLKEGKHGFSLMLINPSYGDTLFFPGSFRIK
jgi:hypothetical protein